MTPASERELALSMMRLWGKNAQQMARNYALDCWRRDDTPGFNRWHCVERIVEQAGAAPVPYAGTVSGLPPRIVRRPRRWFGIPLEVVMPAIRRLGSTAIRGAGL